MSEQKVKDTFFSKNRSLNCRGKLINLETPKVMGILNLSHDSFYDGGQNTGPDEALRRVNEMIEEGVDLIDIGASSSKPGSVLSDPDEEMQKLDPVLRIIRDAHPEIPISIDTYHSKVARTAAEVYGIDIINDISAGDIDENMLSTVAKLNIPYLAMHMKGLPLNMQDDPVYKNVTDEVIRYFSEKVYTLRKKGISDLLIDPGFGFGKTLDHNYELLNNFSSLQMFEIPLVAGVSRKSMIYNLLGSSAEDSLNGTTAVHMILLQKGVNILRVHDVKEAKETIRIYLEANKTGLNLH